MKKLSITNKVLFGAVLSIAVLTPWANASGSKQVTVPKSFGSSRIDNWYAIDRDRIVFEVFGFGDLVAEVFPGCTGLRFSTSLGIRDRAFSLSRGSTLFLSDGERCTISSLTLMQESMHEKNMDAETSS